MENKQKTSIILINIQSKSGKEKEEDYDNLEELERSTQTLREELNQLDAIEKVDLVTKAEVPKLGLVRKSGEAVALGSLLATLATTAGSAIIPSLVNSLQSWLTRHENKKITLEMGGDKLELTGISDKDKQRLIDIWISSHTGQKI
jgi:hypothetical protein